MTNGWPYLKIGHENNPPVVFLHGFLGNSADWDFLKDILARDYFCIFPDLPGHGQNKGGLSDDRLTFKRLGLGLANTLDELGISTAHLIGYSLGGRLAMYFALHFSKRVKSLVLESASPGLVGQNERRARRIEDDRRAAQIRSEGLERFLEDWYRMQLFASLQGRPELLRNLRSRRAQNDPQAMARVIAELSPGRQAPVWDELGDIQAPAMLLAGELDEKYMALVKRMAAVMPNSRLQIAPGVGHNVHIESPEWYIQTIRAFLNINSFLA